MSLWVFPLLNSLFIRGTFDGVEFEKFIYLFGFKMNESQFAST
jgi:hypothetical protein